MDELTQIAAGDPAAFGRWVAGAELPIRQSLRVFAEQVDVEAVVQEALLRAWQIAPRLKDDGKPEPLLRFALTAARNLALNEVRRHRPEGLEPEQLAEAAAREAVATPNLPDPFLRAALQDCHEKLPAQPKKALWARLGAAEAKPDTALAESIGMRLNTFLQNFTRARKLLLKCLEARGILLT